MKRKDPAAWQGSTPPSLIQQRMAIDRVRTRGLLGIWGGLVLLALWFTQLAIAEFDVLHSVLVIFAGMMIGTGIREFTRHKRRRAAFELEHGEGAGKQDAHG